MALEKPVRHQKTVLEVPIGRVEGFAKLHQQRCTLFHHASGPELGVEKRLAGSNRGADDSPAMVGYGGNFRDRLHVSIPREQAMHYSPILLVHICAGTVGLFSGTAALSFRKGSPRHILAGKIFVASMLTMAVGAVYLAVVKHQPNNIGGGIITFYLIGTAWLTARRKEGETSRLDWAALLIPLILGILTWMGGIKVVRSGATSQDGVPVGMNFFMGSICLLAAAGDVRMLLRGGVFGAARIARHLWRMCFGLFIAAGSFFMGPNNRPLRLLTTVGLGQHLSPALFNTNLYLVLSVAPLVLLIFWLVRVRFTKAYKGKSTVPSGTAYSLEA